MKSFLFTLGLLVVLAGSPCFQERVEAGGGRNGISSAADALAGNARRHREGEVIVKFRKGISRARMEEIVRNAGLEIIRVVAAPDLLLLKVPPGSNVQEAIRKISGFGEVEYAEPNILRTEEQGKK
jgi:hypothetical protein